MASAPDAPSQQAGTPAPEPAEGEAKDRFREALERKRSRQHGGNGPGHNDSKVHGEHSRAGGKRSFRRKSG